MVVKNRRKDMLEGASNVVKELQQAPDGEDDFPMAGKGGLERLVRVFGLVMAAVYWWRKKKGAVEPPLSSSTQMERGNAGSDIPRLSAGGRRSCTCWNKLKKE